MSKQVSVRVSPELLAQMCSVEWSIPDSGLESIWCVEGVPASAKYIRGFYDSMRDEFGMIFEHESFAEVEPGKALPEIRVVFQREIKTP